MKQIRKSFSVRLSIRFMFIMTLAIVLLSFGFLFLIRSLVFKSLEGELKNAERLLYEKMERNRQDSENPPLFGGTLGAIPELPYYITYLIYDPEDKRLIATNDPFIPPLEDSKGRAKRYFEKNYFYDGDLNIIYYANTHSKRDRDFLIIAAISMDNNAASKLFSILPFALLCLSLPVLIMSFLLSFFIARKTIQPVLKITRAAQTVTTERLSDLLPISGYGDEIDELSETFNSLFLRLKQDFERERQFSSDVSHELNTPLTVISGQANLLLRWGRDNPEQLEKSLNAIKTEAKTMQAIIANLLQISRIESGRIKPQISEVRLDAMFSWLAEEFSAIAPECEIVTPQNGIVFDTDPEMLHQILTVLISNSVKFADSKCRIELKAEQTDGHIIIEESDNGPGFSEESLPHLFERFYRADESHTRKIAGSGLGLAIALTLCNALGAKIKARNMEPHGAGFTIEF